MKLPLKLPSQAQQQPQVQQTQTQSIDFKIFKGNKMDDPMYAEYIALATEGFNVNLDIKPQTYIIILLVNGIVVGGCCGLLLDQYDLFNAHGTSMFNIINDKNTLLLYNFIVGLQYRCNGYGTKLLQIMRNFAQINNKTKVTLQVDEANKNAVSLYMKNGYLFADEQQPQNTVRWMMLIV